MRSLKSILSIILFSAVVTAQDNLPVIKSNVPTISIQDGEVLKKNGWTLTPEAKPDVYDAELINGEPHKVRGFLQFEAFDKFLVNLYRTRKADQTLADLYPQIMYLEFGARVIPGV